MDFNVIKVAYDYGKKKSEELDLGNKLSNMGSTGQVYDRIQKEYQGGRRNTTQYLEKHGLAKPGGDLKDQVTDPVRMWTEKASYHAFGGDYPGSGGSSGDPSQEAIYADMGSSRKTLLGGRRIGEDKGDDSRRSLSRMNTGTLLTQGKKAKKIA
tara:strand:+ start:6823 stop:7284 length:462 start_codon:yes stop_codon:yes gene_type:complete